MNDEEYIKLRRQLESMTNDEIRVQHHFADEPSSSMMSDLAAVTDRFFPPQVNSVTKSLVTSIYENSIQNGYTPEQRQVTMSIAIPIIAKAFLDKEKTLDDSISDREFVDFATPKLVEIRERIRRLINNDE